MFINVNMDVVYKMVFDFDIFMTSFQFRSVICEVRFTEVIMELIFIEQARYPEMRVTSFCPPTIPALYVLSLWM